MLTKHALTRLSFLLPFQPHPEGVAKAGGRGSSGSRRSGRGRISSRSAPGRAMRSANATVASGAIANKGASQNSLRMLVARKRILLPEEMSQNVAVLQNVALSNGVAIDPKEPMLVVQLDLSKKAFHSQAFQSVLRNNRIRVEDEELGEIEPTVGGGGQGLDRSEKAKARASGIGNGALKEGKETEEKNSNPSSDSLNGKNPAGKQAPANTDGVNLGVNLTEESADGKSKSQANTLSLYGLSFKQELPVSDAFYVRGTTAQLQATLGELQKDTGNFKLLNAQSNGRALSEQNWAFYNRGLEKLERKEMSVAIDSPKPEARPVEEQTRSNSGKANKGKATGKNGSTENGLEVEMGDVENAPDETELDTAASEPSVRTEKDKQSDTPGSADKIRGGKSHDGEGRAGGHRSQDSSATSKETAPVHPVPSADGSRNTNNDVSNKGIKNAKNEFSATTHSDLSFGQAFRLYDPAVLYHLSQGRSSRQHGFARMNSKEIKRGKGKAESPDPSSHSKETQEEGESTNSTKRAKRQLDRNPTKSQAPSDNARKGNAKRKNGDGSPSAPAAQANRLRTLSAIERNGQGSQKQIAVVFVLRIVPDESDASTSDTAVKSTSQNRKEHNQRPGMVAEQKGLETGSKTSKEIPKPKPAAERSKSTPEAPAKTSSKANDD